MQDFVKVLKVVEGQKQKKVDLPNLDDFFVGFLKLTLDTKLLAKDDEGQATKTKKRIELCGLAVSLCIVGSNIPSSPM